MDEQAGAVAARLLAGALHGVFLESDEAVEVVALTATQIPETADRRYPPSLSGQRYPGGIPIIAESQLESIIRARKVDEAVLRTATKQETAPKRSGSLERPYAGGEGAWATPDTRSEDR